MTVNSINKIELLIMYYCILLVLAIFFANGVLREIKWHLHFKDVIMSVYFHRCFCIYVRGM